MENIYSSCNTNEPTKKFKNKPDDEYTVVDLMDYSKTIVALHLIEPCRGTNIFPKTTFGSEQSSSVLSVLKNVLDIKKFDKQMAFLLQKSVVGRSEHYISNFLECTSARIHDTDLEKFPVGIFWHTTCTLPFSTLINATTKQKEDFTHTFNVSEEY